MSEIPERIIKVAVEIYASLNANNYASDCSSYEKTQDIQEIAHAILNERDRCASMVDSFSHGGENYDYDGVSIYQISDAIRG